MTIIRAICALLLFLGPAAAGEASGPWVDATCTKTLYLGPSFVLLSDESGPEEHELYCYLEGLPKPDAEVSIGCSGETKTLKVVNDQTIIFDGIEMKAITGDLSCKTPDQQ